MASASLLSFLSYPSFTHVFVDAHARVRCLAFAFDHLLSGPRFRPRSCSHSLPLRIVEFNYNNCHITFVRIIQFMENGLVKIPMQATDYRFTGSWDFCLLFRSRHILASEDLMVLAQGNVPRCCYSCRVSVCFN